MIKNYLSVGERPSGTGERRREALASAPIQAKGNKMSIRFKILGLGLLAVMATGALAAVNASATQNGHFASHAVEHHLILKGTDAHGTAHQLVFSKPGQTGISCTHTTYHGTISGIAATKTSQITLRPHYTGCATTTGNWGEVTVDVPQTCGTEVFKFTSRTPNGHGTVHVNCTIEITHPNCTITVHPQTPTGGIVYKKDPSAVPAALTPEVTVTGITATYHGICQLLGTNQTGYEMTGSVALWGENTVGQKVGITAT